MSNTIKRSPKSIAEALALSPEDAASFIRTQIGTVLLLSKDDPFVQLSLLNLEELLKLDEIPVITKEKSDG